MVYICCVKGCRNNSISSSLIYFHEFPKDKALKDKWLNAIQCPNWTPPECYRICNDHFHNDQFDHDNNGIKLKEYAVPSYRSFKTETMMNPEYVEKEAINNSKASDVEACRICLATDVKLYNINNTNLNEYIDLVIGLNKASEGLPKYVCYQCAPDLIRCKKLIDKSQTSQATFRNILAKNGEVTQNLIKAQNRLQLNLESPLDSYLLINYYHIQYDDDDENNGSEEYMGNELENDPKDELSETKELLTNIIEIMTDTETVKCDDENLQDINMEMSEAKVSSNVEKSEDNFNMNSNTVEIRHSTGNEPSQKKNSKPGLSLKWKKKGKGKKFNPLLFDNNMAQEQLLEWQKSTLDRNKSGENILKCEVCGKEFTDVEAYKVHVNRHETVHGYYKCKACQKHFSTFRTMTIHSELNHTKKYLCKFCPKTFKNMDDANNHTILGKCMGRNDFKPTFIVPEKPIRPPLKEPIFWDA